MAREPALLLELGISASLGQTERHNGPSGIWGVGAGRPLSRPTCLDARAAAAGGSSALLFHNILARRAKSAAVGLIDLKCRQVVYRTAAMRVTGNDHAEGLILHRFAVAFIGD